MKARGKRRTRVRRVAPRPISKSSQGLKGRNMTTRISPLQGSNALYFRYPGAPCSASLRTCPWLSYLAPSALGVLAFISRLRRSRLTFANENIPDVDGGAERGFSAHPNLRGYE